MSGTTEQDATMESLERRLGKDAARRERLELAHLFKYLAQDNNPRCTWKLKYENVKYESFYRTHKAAIDRLHFIFSKHGIDATDFLTNALREFRVYTPELVLDKRTFAWYLENRARRRQYRTIRDMFMKSVWNVARMCAERGLTPKECVGEMFSRNRIAFEYAAGRVSKHFIASLQNFRELYARLDGINKDELRIIYDAADELKTMLDESLVVIDGKRFTPMAAVEAALKKLKTEQQTDVTNQKTKDN